VSAAVEDPKPSNLHCDIFQLSVKHSFILLICLFINYTCLVITIFHVDFVAHLK